MTDKKYTDEEIIKSLEYCNADISKCYECVLLKDCEDNPFYSPVAKYALELINRQKLENLELRLKVNELLAYKQEVTKKHMKNYETYKSQKAEIERLKGSTIVNNIMESQRIKREAKVEAYKEFTERLKEIVSQNDYPLADKLNSIDRGMFTIGFEQAIDEVLKEMVGERKND